MYQFISVLVILVSVLLILIDLVQESKGGGLAANFSSSNQVMGVRKTTDFLEKATWTLAGALLVLAFVAVMVLPKDTATSSEIDEQLNNLSLPSQEAPVFPATQGEQPQSGNQTEQQPQQ
jgi:preprotein translocase subunit SecG